MTNKPNYYAIIPANIRYDDRLSDSAKLLYGEITSLSNKNGVCWAGNDYFSGLYNTSERTIIRRIRELEKFGYISIDYLYKKDTKFIEKRNIYIIEQYDKSVIPKHDKSVQDQHDKSVTDNNTSNINNTSINNICREVINYLNKSTEKNYRNVEGNIKYVRARVNEGYTVEDFKKVIDNKCLDWLGTEWEKYLQPSTLFGNKFDTYLNTVPKEKDKDDLEFGVYT